MKTNFKSPPNEAKASNVALSQAMVNSACRDAPIKPALRLLSISLLASSRTSLTTRHLSTNAALGAAKCVYVSKKMEGDVPITRHASSAVKLKKGAIQRNIAWVMV